MRIEILLGFVVYVDLKLGYLIFCFGDDEKIIRWKDFELIPFLIFVILENG